MSATRTLFDPPAEAIQAAGDRADRLAMKQWVHRMAEALVAWGRAQPGAFLIEEFRSQTAAQHPLPDGADPRAWGAVTRKAKQLGMRSTGRFARAESSHGSPKQLWIVSAREKT